MATLAQLAKGTRARKTIKLGLGRARISPETGEWETDEGGTITELDIRPLNNIEVTNVTQLARDFAISKGIVDPKDGDELYDDAKVLHTLVVACLDKDSPEKEPRPFFEGGFDELHTTEVLLPDHVGYLFEHQQLWQDECSPRFVRQTPGQFMASVVAAAGGNPSFFVGARPGMRWDSMRTLAAAYLNLMTLTSPTTSGSSSSTPTATLPSETSAPAPAAGKE